MDTLNFIQSILSSAHNSAWLPVCKYWALAIKLGLYIQLRFFVAQKNFWETFYFDKYYIGLAESSLKNSCAILNIFVLKSCVEYECKCISIPYYMYSVQPVYRQLGKIFCSLKFILILNHSKFLKGNSGYMWETKFVVYIFYVVHNSPSSNCWRRFELWFC